MKKIIEEYYTPAQVENEFDLKRSTLRKYSLMIEKINGENYFQRRIINNKETRVYATNEIRSLQEVYRMCVTEHIALNTAIARVFFDSDTAHNDLKTDSDTAHNDLHNDIVALLKNQNEIINNQNEILKNQHEKINELSNKIDDFINDKTLKIESKSEEKRRNFLGFRRKK